MTICVSVKVAEGLVFAADSAVMLQATQIKDGRPVSAIIQSFNFASKVTQVKDYPIGVMSWGLGSLKERSIQSLVMEFEYTYPPSTTRAEFKVGTIANDLVQFIRQRYEDAFPQNNPQTPPPDQRTLGLLIGGFSSDKFFAEQYSFQFPVSQALEVVRPDNPDGSPSFGSNWFGLTDALVRLVKGYDLSAMEELVRRGVDRNVIERWCNDSVSELPLVFQGMPIQDAIDFAEYCVQVVIGRFRFGPGPKLCAGDVDIAIMRPKSFKWAQRKQWSIKD